MLAQCTLALLGTLPLPSATAVDQDVDLTLDINQTVVDLALDTIPSYPHRIIAIQDGKRLVPDQPVIEDGGDSFRDYMASAYDVADQFVESLEEDASDEAWGEAFAAALADMDLPLADDRALEDNLASLYGAGAETFGAYEQDLQRLESLRDRRDEAEALEVATLGLAAYVLENTGDFDAETEALAHAVLDASFVNKGLEDKALGFGKLWKKAKRAVKKVAKKVGKWVMKGVKRHIQIEKPKLVYLNVWLNHRPTIELRNPLRVRDLDLTVNGRIRINWKWRLFGKWHHRHFFIGTSGIQLEIASNIDLKTKDDVKVQATPRVTKMLVPFKILGIKFKLSLRGITNKHLAKKQFTVFDASKFELPLGDLGKTLKIQRLVVTTATKGLRIGIRLIAA